MATLHLKSENKRIALRARSLLGRHPECHVPIDSPKVSGEHAGLYWVDKDWVLRDLGSRNGTYVNGRRLTAGERLVLQQGMTFSLSHSAAVFELVDASPPAAIALHMETGRAHVADRGILALPSEHQARITIFSTSDGSWQIEADSHARPAVDREIIKLGDATYVLELPVRQDQTVQSGMQNVPIESIALHFAVTPDEEHVEVTVRMAGESKRLETREYHYMLVTLARARIADAHAPSSLRGWIDRDELCKKLNMDLGRLNVDIFRARKQLAALGVEGAARLVERRPGTHEIRLGVSMLEVVQA
jgi:pSer/pThr/pTyr-binding forkhead associated (FHA) protein